MYTVCELSHPDWYWISARLQRGGTKPMAKQKDEQTQVGPEEQSSGPGSADSMNKRRAMKQAILSAMESEGRRLTVAEARSRFTAEMPLAEDVIQELAAKGILKSEALFGEAAWNSSELGKTLAEVAREVGSAFKEAVEIAREAYRSEQHRLGSYVRDGMRARPNYRRSRRERTVLAAQDPTPVHQSKDAFSSSADPENYDVYFEKIEGDARHATGSFIGHLVPFVMVNGFLMVLNATVSPGFPWALFPFGGWGIGLLEHFASGLRAKDKYQELKKLPYLNDEQLSIFKKLQKKKDELWQSGTGLIPTSAFLLMINLITSRGFLWSLIPIFFMSMGFLCNLVKIPGEIGALKQDLQDSLQKAGRRGINRPQKTVKTGGPYAAFIDEAKEVRETILEMIALPQRGAKQGGKQKSTQKAGVPEAEELIPVLNAYVEQVQLLAERTAEVDRIIELIPQGALQRDRAVLEQRIKEQQKAELRQEYEKALAELERQEASYNELCEQRDLLELKLRSSVNNLKQMQIDIGRIISLIGSNESGADRSLHCKAEELNRYIEDLRRGYEEVERLETRAGKLPTDG